jgi:hypothetical protein
LFLLFQDKGFTKYVSLTKKKKRKKEDKLKHAARDETEVEWGGRNG